jgi:hypothetical protein
MLVLRLCERVGRFRLADESGCLFRSRYISDVRLVVGFQVQKVADSKQSAIVWIWERSGQFLHLEP